ncbi:MAG: hypothetical protein KAH67_10125 [Flavobacteriaceae bacterium]|nr:hypothetical protein [Candidatus Gracilibacteria bacterium]MCK5639061.1 hypothetical protein [Flavobacteriaceae bacterium]
MGKTKQFIAKKEKEILLLQLIMKKIRKIKERKIDKKEELVLENFEEQLNQI